MFKKIVSLLICCMLTFATLSITGCSKEVEPYFKPDEYENKIPVAEFRNSLNWDTKEFYDCEEDFTAFYENEITKKQGIHFYFLNPEFKAEYTFFSYHSREYDFFADEGNQQAMMMTELMALYDSEYERLYPSRLEGYYTGMVETTIKLYYITAAIEDSVTGQDFRLQFSHEPFENSPEWRFINIYIGNVCIGTCYYIQGVPNLTREWFENYFEKNLYKR